MTIAMYTPAWDLRGRAQQDAGRHDKLIQDAIRKNLKDMISREDIIVSDGTRRVRIPMRYLEQYHFKYGHPMPGAGHGPGKVGDTLWQPGQQPGSGDAPGDESGEHGYDVEVDIETLTKVMVEELHLPWLEEKPAARQIAREDYQYTDRRRRGMPGNIDKRQTLRENLKRNAAKQRPGVHDLVKEDLRYRVPDVHYERSSNAAVYLLMDRSGSMRTEKKFIAKAVCFWLVRFLRLKYQHVEIVFIAHDTEAEIVSEHDFFGQGEGGGTECSSALTVALQQITQHHPRARWNVFVWHFSDGDNGIVDNALCKTRVESLLQECTMVAYGEILWASDWAMPSTLSATLRQIQHPRLLITVLRTRDDVRGALQAFLGAEVRR